jgi:transcriptional regulator with XRE-family HTH domain
MPMTVEEALELLWAEAKRSSQARLAKRVKVSPATITRWKGGVCPEGESREKLLAWAEGQGPTTAPAEQIIADAARQTRRNLVRLSEISGYAKRVLEEMRSVTASQERVVDQLAPYVLLEEEVYGDPVELADTIEDITRDAREKQAGETPTPGASPRRERTSGGG